jgi:hypothetical protein
MEYSWYAGRIRGSSANERRARSQATTVPEQLRK